MTSNALRYACGWLSATAKATRDERQASPLALTGGDARL